MTFEKFCSAIAAYTDMREANFISEKEFQHNVNKLWNIVRKLSYKN